MNINEIHPPLETPIVIINAKTASVIVHWGTAFGPACGAGFNRKGGSPNVKRVEMPVTCTRKACAKHS